MKKDRSIVLALALTLATVFCGALVAAEAPSDAEQARAAETVSQTPEPAADVPAVSEDCAASEAPVFVNPASEVVLARSFDQRRPCPPGLSCDNAECNAYCASLPSCVGGGCIDCKCTCICW